MPLLTCQVVPDEDCDWAARYEAQLRALPLAAGAAGIAGVLLNRLAGGVAPVVDASSSQSRADVVVILLSAVLTLTGLQWLSLRPVEKEPVALNGTQLTFLDAQLPAAVAQELQWAWGALGSCTRCSSLVVFLGGRCVCLLGAAANQDAAQRAAPGAICKQAVASGRGNYLANLVLYPGRVEFEQYLPDNTQGVIVQPIGDQGVLIAATDTQRGFGKLDQAWIATIADKLDSSFEQGQVAQQETQGAASQR